MYNRLNYNKPIKIIFRILIKPSIDGIRFVNDVSISLHFDSLNSSICHINLPLQPCIIVFYQSNVVSPIDIALVDATFVFYNSFAIYY